MNSKQKLYDVFLFLNELDLLELRLKTLFNVVDYFVITEINETFSGKVSLVISSIFFISIVSLIIKFKSLY